METRDITTATLEGNEVRFSSIIGVFSNKYPKIIQSDYIKKEVLIFNSESDAENYFNLETIKLKPDLNNPTS